MSIVNYDKLRSMIARCEWTFAKSMPFAPHEYIVRNKCPLTDDEFVYFVEMQRQFGKKERWGKYNNSYLYIDGYKYWTMGAPMDDTMVINRAKACVVNEAHQLYEVKTALNPFDCVTEALGQLCQYAYLFCRDKIGKMVIAGASEPTKEVEHYLATLRKNHSLSIYYIKV